MLENLKTGFESIHADVALLKLVFLNQPQLGVVNRAADDVLGKLKVPEPKKFEGARSAKDLENFIWDMQECFTAATILY